VEDLCVKWELSGNRARIGYFGSCHQHGTGMEKDVYRRSLAAGSNRIARGANEQAKQVVWETRNARQKDSRSDGLNTEGNVMSHEYDEKRTNKSKIRKISTGALKDVPNIADLIENDDDDQPVQSYAEVASGNGKPAKTGKPSDIYGNKDIKKKRSRPILPRYQNSDEVVTTFHVHMPKLKDIEVYVFGSIDELGSWGEAKVCLRRYKESNYWYSDPVRIPTHRFAFAQKISYKYVIISKGGGFLRQLWNNSAFMTFEGYDGRDNRELDPEENQYDIWKRNYKYSLHERDIYKSFCFPTQIFETITEANFKAKLMDYLRVFKKYRDLCQKTVDVEFISNHAYDTSQDAQRVFLCILLGMLAKNSHYGSEVRLNDTFPSADLLNSLSFIDGDDTLLKDVVDLLSHAVRVLVRHNWDTSDSFEWMGMFEVAAFIDPKYSFLDSVRRRELNSDQSDRFCKCLVEQKLNMERETDIQYIRLVRSFIDIAANIRILVFLWKEMIRPEMKTNEALKQNWMARLNEIIKTDNATRLRVHLDELPDDLDIEFSSLFIKSIIDLLNGQRSKWDRDNVKEFVALFEDDRLLWTSEDRMKVLNSVSTSRNMEILDVFVELLRIVLDKIHLDAKMNARLGEYCTQWFERVISQIKELRKSSRANGYNYVYTVYKRLSTIYPILEDRRTIKNELFNIADEQIAPFEEAQIYAAVKDIGNLQVKEILKSFNAIVQRKLGQSS
ncbi:4659_t:CDS:2, partial [Paraglomus occultum]